MEARRATSAADARRWLTEDAIKPWQHRSWIFITDPGFRTEAARVLDLYARTWQGEQLGEDEYVISADENTVMVHTPVHASWLNQVEIYFSVVQRKVVSPNDFTDLTKLTDRLREFEDRYNATAQPFQWKSTTADLDDLPARLDRHTTDHHEESSVAPAA
ncbi:hypothetical protein [Streptomyces sp. CB01580]|uniref:hypothetical protein n=1 Tax=Streptomyces sp. CB01580 TaxID=1703933 RepID=UPI000B23535C|nr:hypothetical protein [Streptomyces sp. CB01580]